MTRHPPVRTISQIPARAEPLITQPLIVALRSLITDTFGITPALAAIYRASGQDIPASKRILELNPTHPLVVGLRQAHHDRSDDPTVAETAELLYGTVLLAEGGAPDDPARFAELVADRLARTI